MDALIQTFEEYFSKTIDYETSPEQCLEYVGTHTHNGHEGFLFKLLKESNPLFVRKDQLLNEPPQLNTIYIFAGFIAHSSVAVIAKK